MTKRRKEKEEKSAGCKTPTSIFNTMELLQMMGKTGERGRGWGPAAEWKVAMVTVLQREGWSDSPKEK